MDARRRRKLSRGLLDIIFLLILILLIFYVVNFRYGYSVRGKLSTIFNFKTELISYLICFDMV